MKNDQKPVSHAELVIYIRRRKMGYGEVEPRLEQAYAELAIDHPEKYREKYNECLKEAKAWNKSLDNDAKRHFKCLQKAEKF